eukprot:5970436-Pyramimonas_sp.AAC.1
MAAACAGWRFRIFNQLAPIAASWSPLALIVIPGCTWLAPRVSHHITCILRIARHTLYNIDLAAQMPPHT